MTNTFSQNEAAINGIAFASVPNLAAGGPIGTAAITVDNYQGAYVTQTTAAQTLTIPAPTGDSPKVFTIVNTGSTSFTIYQKVVFPGTGLNFVYSGTAIANQGKIWAPIGGVSATVTTTTTL